MVFLSNMLNITDLMQFSNISCGGGGGAGGFLPSGTLSSRFLSHENEANITNEDTILMLTLVPNSIWTACVQIFFGFVKRHSL